MKEKNIYFTFEKETKEFENDLFYFTGKVIIFLYEIKNNELIPFYEEIETNINNIHRYDDWDIIEMVESIIKNTLYDNHHIYNSKLNYL